MTIYCDKCGARHDCSVCPVCSGFGLSNLQVAAGIGKSFQPTDELQTLRAKFEAWYPDAIGDVQPFECYMKGYASRDAEVEALKRDAERYRWLLDTGLDDGNGWHLTQELPNGMEEIHLFADRINDAIDAAMAKESGE